jgi:hypothetical protein
VTAPEKVRLPSGPITPHGVYHLMKGDQPVVWLTSHDGTVITDLVGPWSTPDKYEAPECVQLGDSPKGLIAAWTSIDQQGANEDGKTFIDAANEALEIDLPVRCVARDGVHLRRVINLLIGSIDSIRTATLHWWTPDQGYWYTPVRWFKPPPEGFQIGGQQRVWEWTLRLRGDGGFWRGLPDVDEFRFAYDAMREDFDVDYPDSLGPDWPMRLTGRGGGYPYVHRGAARWRDQPGFLTEGRTLVAGPRRDFETETNNQVIEVDLASLLAFGAAVDVFGRMGRQTDGAWNGYGTRYRIVGSTIQLHAINNYVETHINTWLNFVPPLPGETWYFEFGDEEGNERAHRVRRGFFNGSVTAFKAEDEGAVAQVGPNFRGVGWGSYATGSWIGQGDPAAITSIRAGDATTSTQSGHLERFNVGTVPRWDTYTLTGPGIFEIATGPGSSQMVKVGPLLPNQVVRLNTDGQKARIQDFTRVPATAAELLEYREWLDELKSWAPDADEANASVFGVVPPQGNMHRTIEGWFTRPIPPRLASGKAQIHTVAVSISGGNANSRIVASGVPRQRGPQS